MAFLLQVCLLKFLIAIADTPLLYLGVYLMRKRFNLKLNDTLKIN